MTARDWLDALAAKGVTVTLRGNRLALTPATAYGALTDDELLTLRHHRAAIKALVQDGYAPAVMRDAGLPVSETATPAGEAVLRTPAPAPEPPRNACPHCAGDLSVYEPGTPRFEHLLSCARAHADPEQERRRQQENVEMLHQLGAPSRWDY